MLTAGSTSGQNHNSSIPVSIKPEIKLVSLHTTNMVDPAPPSSSGPVTVDGYEKDAALSKSEFMTRLEVINRRARRVKQLAQIYCDHYWALMEELKLKYREYYWEYGKSPVVEYEENERINSSRVDPITAENSNGKFGVNSENSTGNVASRCGDRSRSFTRLSIKSSTSGPILCGKPILRSTLPSYCSAHFQKAERHMVRALKKSGLNICSTSKLASKLHVQSTSAKSNKREEPQIKEIWKMLKLRRKTSLDDLAHTKYLKFILSSNCKEA